MVTEIQNIINKSITVKQQILQDEALLSKIELITTATIKAFGDGNKVLFCGNGGSAADAQHLSAEFSGRFYTDRNPLPSEALHCNTSYLTAVANDYGYDQVYSRIVKAVGKPGDILIALSTSGNSENIVKAVQQANELGMITIAFTGAAGGRLKGLAQHLINVPSSDTPRIQEAHIMLGHIVCQLVEAKLF